MSVLLGDLSLCLGGPTEKGQVCFYAEGYHLKGVWSVCVSIQGLPVGGHNCLYAGGTYTGHLSLYWRVAPIQQGAVSTRGVPPIQREGSASTLGVPTQIAGLSLYWGAATRGMGVCLYTGVLPMAGACL